MHPSSQTNFIYLFIRGNSLKLSLSYLISSHYLGEYFFFFFLFKLSHSKWPTKQILSLHFHTSKYANKNSTPLLVNVSALTGFSNLLLFWVLLVSVPVLKLTPKLHSGHLNKALAWRTKVSLVFLGSIHNEKERRTSNLHEIWITFCCSNYSAVIGMLWEM